MNVLPDIINLRSISYLKELTETQIATLNKLKIFRLSDLLHFQPIINAKLLANVSKEDRNFDISTSNLLIKGFENTKSNSIVALPISALVGFEKKEAELFSKHFGIQNIGQLSNFKPYLDAEKAVAKYATGISQTHEGSGETVTNNTSEFSEPLSAPKELVPKIVGSVSSKASYSNFIKEKRLRFKGLELSVDEQKFFVDQKLAQLFFITDDILTKNFVETPEIQVGYISKLSQQWINNGTHLGEVIHSLPLAPGESRNIAVIDWKSKQTGTRKENTKANEQLTNDLFHKRALDEVTRSTAAEHQGGGTDIAAATIATAGAGVLGAALVGGIAGALPGAAIGALLGTPAAGVGAVPGALAGAVIGFGVGASIGVGVSLIGTANAQLGTIQSDSNGDRSIDAAISQNIDESIQQKSSSIRSLWSSVIVTDEQAEHENLTTRNITNYNHSHALTIQYFELLQHYRTELCMTQAEPFLLLPFAPLNFTFDLIADFWDILKRGVKDINLLNDFEKLINGNEETANGVGVVKLDLLQVLLTRNNGRSGGNIFGISERSNIYVRLIGTGFTQSAEISQSQVQFAFQENPAAQNLTGIQVEGLDSGETVYVFVSARMKGENNESKSKKIRNVAISADTAGTLSYNFSLIENDTHNHDGSKKSITEIVKYFNAHRYFFTRLLLLAIEKEQLIDLVEALILRVPNISERRGVGAVAGAALDKSPKSVNAGKSAATNTDSTVFVNLVLTAVVRLLRESIDRNVTSVSENASLITQVRDVEKSIKEYIKKTPKGPKNEIEKSEVENSIINIVENFLTKNTALTKDKKQIVDELRNAIEQAFKSLENKDSDDNGFIHLSEFIDTTPFAITGNTLMFKMKKITDSEVLQNSLLRSNKKLQELRDYPVEISNYLKNILQNKAEHTVSSDIFLPTSGVFAEAILGRSNASEKIDITRYINWQDMPIPHLAPAINALTQGQHNSNPLVTTPTVPGNVLNILNPPQLPDPTGMAAILGAIQNGNIFRDMSKSDQLVTVMSNLSNLAQSMAQQAGSLAGQAQSDALKAATEIGKQVAQLASQAANQPSNGPSTFTEKGGAANSLEKFFSDHGGSSSSELPDALRNILGVGGNNETRQSVQPSTQPFLNDKKNISDLIGEFSNSGLGEMKLNTDGGNIELKSAAEKSNVQNAGFIDLGTDDLPANLIFWEDVFNHTVPENIVAELNVRDLKVQDLNSAQDTLGIFRAALNLDFYQVRINEMPERTTGIKFTEEEFLKEIRIQFSDLHSTKHIDDNPFTKDESFLKLFPELKGGGNGSVNLIPFMLRANTTFAPFNDIIDKPKWESNDPLHAVMQFLNPVDNMAVVASKVEKDFWIFSTVGQFTQGFLDFDTNRLTGKVGSHPVSGNRMFALKKQANGEFIFFTKGADRTSGLGETILSPVVFAGGHGIWLSLQAGIANFVNTNNGKAEIIEPVSQRFEYKKVLEFFQNKNGTGI